MSRVLTIGDVHEPVSHPGYKAFCEDLYDKYNCDRVVFIGDVADLQAVSFHAHNPECPGSHTEYELTLSAIKKWHDAFPKAHVCIGNHDERIVRVAASVNIAAVYLHKHTRIWKTPGWKWNYEHIIDGVYYFHGTQNGGVHPAWNAAGKMLMPVVMGHLHSKCGVSWRANPRQRIFALDTGCGIDVDAYQFAYGRHLKERPILAAAVVLDGIPYSEIMPMAKGEKYHRSRF